MPRLTDARAGKPFPKAGETVRGFVVGFDYKNITKKDGTQMTLLIGKFADEDGREYEASFGQTNSINTESLNNLLNALNKDIIDEISITTLDLPDVGENREDWSDPIGLVFTQDSKNPAYVRLTNFDRI